MTKEKVYNLSELDNAISRGVDDIALSSEFVRINKDFIRGIEQRLLTMPHCKICGASADFGWETYQIGSDRFRRQVIQCRGCKNRVTHECGTFDPKYTVFRKWEELNKKSPSVEGGALPDEATRG